MLKYHILEVEILRFFLRSTFCLLAILKLLSFAELEQDVDKCVVVSRIHGVLTPLGRALSLSLCDGSYLANLTHEYVFNVFALPRCLKQLLLFVTLDKLLEFQESHLLFGDITG